MLDYRVVHRAKTVDMLSPQEWVGFLSQSLVVKHIRMSAAVVRSK